ncbi:MAG: hypothetical protein JWM98_2402 [Thermoleophilia bacterium]|nr:hypothetical protein [Thermoleophilia bacterium]
MRRPLALAVLVLAAALAGATASAPPQVAGAADDIDPGSAVTSSDPKAMRTSLRELARAWSDGGGKFGYPYWSKAQQRWRTHEITAPMFREYVTGYRDRLVLGCDLLDEVSVDEDVARSVAELVVEACRRRVDALREQQRYLGDTIRSAAGGPDVDTEALDASAADHEAKAGEAMEQSFRDTRLAMDRAQAALDAADFDRLHEDAFL